MHFFALLYYSINPPGLLPLQKCIACSYPVNRMCLAMVTSVGANALQVMLVT